MFSITDLGRYQDTQLNRIVMAFNYGEDCNYKGHFEREIVTISAGLDVGAHGSGESGVYPPTEFQKRFKFIKK